MAHVLVDVGSSAEEDTRMTASMSALVDPEAGIISRRIFIEPEIYETELR